MSELTKARTTHGFVDFSLRVPEAQARKVQDALAALLALLRDESSASPRDFADDALYDADAVFGPPTPAKAVRGYRTREGLTQAALAKALGTSRSVICDLENGRRPVSKGMAQRLAKALSAPYKAFL